MLPRDGYAARSPRRPSGHSDPNCRIETRPAHSQPQRFVFFSHNAQQSWLMPLSNSSTGRLESRPLGVTASPLVYQEDFDGSFVRLHLVLVGFDDRRINVHAPLRRIPSAVRGRKQQLVFVALEVFYEPVRFDLLGRTNPAGCPQSACHSRPRSVRQLSKAPAEIVSSFFDPGQSFARNQQIAERPFARRVWARSSRFLRRGLPVLGARSAEGSSRRRDSPRDTRTRKIR